MICYLGRIMKEISRPVLLLDEAKCRSNIRRMVDKARQNGVRFRPHFKTHQSISVGEWFRQEGVEQITVSSVAMAEFFVAQGWKDITIAFPFNIRETEKLNRVLSRVVVNVVLIEPGTLRHLVSHLKHPVGGYIKVDTGYHRTGLLPDEKEKMEELLQGIEGSENIRFQGFMDHTGHTYDVRSKEEVVTIHHRSVEELNALSDHYQGRFPGIELSIGDTPSCSLLDDLGQVDEVRPGNFVFYDLQQERVGGCSFEDIAVALACPVVAKHASRHEVVLYGGAVHLSKDSVMWKGKTIYGRPVDLLEQGWGEPWEGCYLRKLSQEHGILKVTPEQFDRVEVGQLIGVLPAHSCLTVDAMGGYLDLSGHFHIRGPK